jgi:predicted Zn-dependent peptidase
VQDLQEARLEQAVEFHRKFYGPGNATLVVTGDMIQAETLAKIRKHFEGIPNNTNAEQPELSEPQQLEEKLESMSDPLAVLPAVIIGYHIPPLGSTDDYALAMAALVLADGDSSRFYRRFVYENNWIAGLVAGSNHYRGPQLFRVWFQIQQNVPTSTILEAMENELDRLKDSGITDTELEKAQNQVAHRLVAQMERVSNVGELLAQYSSFFDDPNLANRQLERFLSVSKEQIQLAVQRYLSRENRTVIIVEPGASE